MPRIATQGLEKNLGVEVRWGNNLGKLIKDNKGYYLTETQWNFRGDTEGRASVNLAAISERIYLQSGDVITKIERYDVNKPSKFRVMNYTVDLGDIINK